MQKLRQGERSRQGLDECARAESASRLATLEKRGVLAALPATLQRLIGSAGILLAGPESHYLPVSIQTEFRQRRGSGFGTRGLAVCVLREDGQVVVALDDDAEDLPSLQHELIHAAQVFASPVAMQNVFREVAEDGRMLVASIVDICGDMPHRDGPFADVEWTATACSASREMNEARALKDPADRRDAYSGALDLALLLHPRDATAEAGRLLGLVHRSQVVSALHAYFMVQEGFDQWRADVAREIVARRFERQWHPAAEQLATDALACVLGGRDRAVGKADDAEADQSLIMP